MISNGFQRTDGKRKSNMVPEYQKVMLTPHSHFGELSQMIWLTEKSRKAHHCSPQWQMLNLKAWLFSLNGLLSYQRQGHYRISLPIVYFHGLLRIGFHLDTWFSVTLPWDCFGQKSKHISPHRRSHSYNQRGLISVCIVRVHFRGKDWPVIKYM